jgi:hypothetical protein
MDDLRYSAAIRCLACTTRHKLHSITARDVGPEPAGPITSWPNGMQAQLGQKAWYMQNKLFLLFHGILRQAAAAERRAFARSGRLRRHRDVASIANRVGNKGSDIQTEPIVVFKKLKLCSIFDQFFWGGGWKGSKFKTGIWYGCTRRLDSRSRGSRGTGMTRESGFASDGMKSQLTINN